MIEGTSSKKRVSPCCLYWELLYWATLWLVVKKKEKGLLTTHHAIINVNNLVVLPVLAAVLVHVRVRVLVIAHVPVAEVVREVVKPVVATSVLVRAKMVVEEHAQRNVLTIAGVRVCQDAITPVKEEITTNECISI